MAATRQLVVFSLGGQEYAPPVATVSEIIRHAAPRAIASATSSASTASTA
jgi:chemotaxis signal transduction protein